MNVTSFCAPNETFFNVWRNNSLNPCFFDTISSSVIAGFIFIFGVTQLVIYKKYATRIESHRLRKSFLYVLQILLMIFLPLLSVIRFFLRWKVYEPYEIYGYMVS